jgi:ATP-binding cassette subfamily B protein
LQSTSAGKLFRAALRAHWPVYALGSLTLIATSLAEVLVPKFVQWSLDVIAGRGDGGWQAAVPGWLVRADRLTTLRALAAAFAALLLVGLVGRFGWRQLLARRTHVEGRNIKVRYWSVLRYLPLSVFQRYSLGDLMNRATGDWSATRTIFGFTLVLTLDLVFFTLLSVASMLTISVELTVYCLAIFPFLPRLILRLARREHDQHLHAQEKLGHLSEAISQSLSTIRLQRATRSDSLWQTTLAREARDYADRRFEVAKTGWRIFPLGALPTLVAYAILLVLGVRKILAGELSIGQFVALQSYVLMLQGPLFDMGDCIAEWQKGFASLKRIVEIFNLQSLADRLLDRAAVPAADAGAPVVEARGLTFAYDDAATPVLRGVSLVIRPGETVGIFGPIGGGKSTLLKVLSGLVDPPAGAVRLAGVDAAEVARAWLSRHVTMVPQRAFLFAGSVRSNLELDERYPDTTLWHVLSLVRLEQDIRALPQGLDSWVGEWGINLSGGQKQRLSLARALLRQRDLILLDDCLSAVDAVTEEAILAALRPSLGSGDERGAAPAAELPAPSAVVWVAHRMSTLKLCDRIYQLEGGVLTPVSRAAAAAALALAAEAGAGTGADAGDAAGDVPGPLRVPELDAAAIESEAEAPPAAPPDVEPRGPVEGEIGSALAEPAAKEAADGAP